jgi:hypothetical protein
MQIQRCSQTIIVHSLTKIGKLRPQNGPLEAELLTRGGIPEIVQLALIFL